MIHEATTSDGIRRERSSLPVNRKEAPMRLMRVWLLLALAGVASCGTLNENSPLGGHSLGGDVGSLWNDEPGQTFTRYRGRR